VLDARVDVAEFRALAARVEEARDRAAYDEVVDLVAQAEALYRGDLDVCGSECRLLHEARRELVMVRLNLLLEAAEAAGQCADWHRSLDVAQRAAAIEMTDRSTRAAMRAWFGLGEAGKPVEEFERLRAHLGEEYGVDPAPETRALYLELINSVWDEWPPQGTMVGRCGEIRAAVSAALARLMDGARGGVVWLVGREGSGRVAIAQEAARTLAPMTHDGPGPADPRTQVLATRQALTEDEVESLRRRAADTGLVIFVPVDEASAAVLGCGEAVVEVPPLERCDFDRLMSFVLQARPAARLLDELYAESRGLPGLACHLARRHMADGSLTWGPSEVDRVRRPRRRPKLVQALVAWPLALLWLLGGEKLAEESRIEALVEDRAKHGILTKVPVPTP
jgi:hypothetical protein